MSTSTSSDVRSKIEEVDAIGPDYDPTGASPDIDIKVDGRLPEDGLEHQPSRFVEGVTATLHTLTVAVTNLGRCIFFAVYGLDIKLTREELSKMSHIRVRLHDAVLLLFWTGSVVLMCALTRDVTATAVVRDGIWNWPTAHMNLQYFGSGLIASSLLWGFVRSLQRREVSKDEDADE